MRPLDAVIDGLPFPHRNAQGQPLASLENVELLLREFGGIVARPRLNAEQPIPFFPGRPNAQTPELQRDVQLAKLTDICRRHDMTISIATVARHTKLLAIEREDAARQDENARLLALIESGAVEDPDMPAQGAA